MTDVTDKYWDSRSDWDNRSNWGTPVDENQSRYTCASPVMEECKSVNTVDTTLTIGPSTSTNCIMLTRCQNADQKARLVLSAQQQVTERSDQTIAGYIKVFYDVIKRNKLTNEKKWIAEKDVLIDLIKTRDEVIEKAHMKHQAQMTNQDAETQTTASVIEDLQINLQRQKMKSSDDIITPSYLRSPLLQSYKSPLRPLSRHGSDYPLIRRPSGYNHIKTNSNVIARGGRRHIISGVPSNVVEDEESSQKSTCVVMISPAAHTNRIRDSQIRIDFSKLDSKTHEQKSPFLIRHETHLSTGVSKDAKEVDRTYVSPPVKSKPVKTGRVRKGRGVSAIKPLKPKQAGEHGCDNLNENDICLNQAAATETPKKRTGGRTQLKSRNVVASEVVEMTTTVEPSIKLGRSYLTRNLVANMTGSYNVEETECSEAKTFTQQKRKNGKTKGVTNAANEHEKCTNGDENPDECFTSRKKANECLKSTDVCVEDRKPHSGKRPRVVIKNESTVDHKDTKVYTRRGVARSNKIEAIDDRLKKEATEGTGASINALPLPGSLNTSWADDDNSEDIRTVKKRKILPSYSQVIKECVNESTYNTTPLKARLRKRKK